MTAPGMSAAVLAVVPAARIPFVRVPPRIRPTHILPLRYSFVPGVMNRSAVSLLIRCAFSSPLID
jgi:hypothetical protein